MVAPDLPDTPPGEGDGEPASEKPATEPVGGSVTDRRRHAAVAGHGGDVKTARAALTDPDPSVRSTALGAAQRLHVLGEDDLRDALADEAPAVRRRACELASGFPTVNLSVALGDTDPSVVEMAAWASGEREERSSVPTLASLASVGSGHPDPLCREAAVAALGAIGDSRGLPAIMDALEDKPAVRRRAAVALAAFEGPRVEAALRRCLEDRDWQVRQVAEDLLGTE